MQLALFVFAAAASLSTLGAATLTSISGDTFGVPRQFNLIDLSSSTASSPYSLGDLSTGFTGGLAWDESSGRYWTIYESMGQSRLASFDASGPASLLDAPLALSPGMWRGLTYSPHNSRFYALYTDGSAPLTFQEIDLGGGSVTSLFQAPAAGFGGMTYVSPGKLTALFTNLGGNFQLHDIDLAAQIVTPFGATFNVNMNGGLALDTTTMARYLAIGSDFQGNSTLYSITADGSAWGSQFSVGGAYFYSALSYRGSGVPITPGPDTPVPEPSSFYLAVSAMLFLAAFSRRRVTRRAQRAARGLLAG
jgi:hypothetical protein